MNRESFFRHFAAHWAAYLLLTGACLLAGITLFQVTEPESAESRSLLINAGGAVPSVSCSAEVQYPGEDSTPEVVQAYVLTTGSGDFDYYIAPIANLQEMYDQQLLLPIGLSEAIAVADGTPVASALNDEYCLCLAHTADADAIAAIGRSEEIPTD